MENKGIETETLANATHAFSNGEPPKQSDFKEEIIKELLGEIPDTIKIDIPREISAEGKIDSFNEVAGQALVDAYTKSEEFRLGRQKPIMISVLIVLSVQLVAFNTLIFILLFKSIPIVSVQHQLFVELLDFLKYYIGAVIVELIGLMIIITKNTFSIHLDKTIEKLVSMKKPK